MLANDRDPDGDALVVASVWQPAHGVVTLAGPATVAFAPEPGHTGSVRFLYVVSDGRGGLSAATVTVAVGSTGDAGADGGADTDAALDAAAGLDVPEDGGGDLDASAALDAGGVEDSSRDAADGAAPADAGDRVDGAVDADAGDAAVADASGAVPVSPCGIAAIDGLPPSGPVRPGQVVLLDGSFAPTMVGASVTRVHWRPQRLPQGSHMTLADRTDRGALLTTDLAGRYLLRAEVTDSAGAMTPHDCALDAVPGPALYLELVWDKPSPDVDLRLLKQTPDGRYCAAPDGQIPIVFTGLAQDCGAIDNAQHSCWFSNCRDSSGGPTPDWDGDQVARSSGDPLLRIDDFGYGPEVIQIEATTPGHYLVAAHHWKDNDAGPTRVALRVYLHGQLQAHVASVLPSNAWWEALQIHWPEVGSSAVCIDTLDGEPPVCLDAPSCTPVATCRQCLDDASCGPGTACDRDQERCVAVWPTCTSDDGCDSGQRCVPATGTCEVSDCRADDTCLDPRMVCDPDLRQCVLPPARCSEAHEPNNTLDSATLATGNPHADVLCRGDLDVIGIPVQAGTRLGVEVTVNQTGLPARGIEVELLDDTGTARARSTIEASRAWLAVNVDLDGIFYVVLYGSGETADVYDYSLDVTYGELLSCDDEPGEPNDLLEQAPNSVLVAGHHERLLCQDEQDHHLLTVPAGQRATIRVTFDPDAGALQLLLLRDTVVVNTIYTESSPTTLISSVAATTQDLVLQVQQNLWRSHEPEQSYLVDVDLAPPPQCADAYEPNDTRALAPRIGLGALSSNLCDADDVDYFALHLPEGGSAGALVTFSLNARGILTSLVNTAGTLVSAGYSPVNQGLSSLYRSDLPAGYYYLVITSDDVGNAPVDRQSYVLEVQGTGIAELSP